MRTVVVVIIVGGGGGGSGDVVVGFRYCSLVSVKRARQSNQINLSFLFVDFVSLLSCVGSEI